jgi:plasmid stabilization system protein ParE
MKLYRIEVSPRARRQLEQKLASRHLSPTVLRAEVREALQLLSRHPEAGPRDHDVVGVRRLLLSRSQHLLYYEVDHTRATIEIIALWHTARGGAPPL